MARLTLTFKDRTLQVRSLAEGETFIGRDPDNHIPIDSLAVAPRHAVIHFDAGGAYIRQLDRRFPLAVNGVKVAEKPLVHGDAILIGKHTLLYDDEPHRISDEVNSSTIRPSSSQAAPQRWIEAGLQLLSGQQIGRIIPLRGGLTRLGNDHTAAAVVARRREGYVLSALTGGEAICVNETPVNDESVLLKDGDTVRVDKDSMQFFCRSERLDVPGETVSAD